MIFFWKGFLFELKIKNNQRSFQSEFPFEEGES